MEFSSVVINLWTGAARAQRARTAEAARAAAGSTTRQSLSPFYFYIERQSLTAAFRASPPC